MVTVIAPWNWSTVWKTGKDTVTLWRIFMWVEQSRKKLERLFWHSYLSSHTPSKYWVESHSVRKVISAIAYAHSKILQSNILIYSEIKYFHWYKYLTVYKMSITQKKLKIQQIVFLRARWCDDISIWHSKQKYSACNINNPDTV